MIKVSDKKKKRIRYTHRVNFLIWRFLFEKNYIVQWDEGQSLLNNSLCGHFKHLPTSMVKMGNRSFFFFWEKFFKEKTIGKDAEWHYSKCLGATHGPSSKKEKEKKPLFVGAVWRSLIWQQPVNHEDGRKHKSVFERVKMEL